jgi:hypothetical protein
MAILPVLAGPSAHSTVGAVAAQVGSINAGIPRRSPVSPSMPPCNSKPPAAANAAPEPGPSRLSGHRQSHAHRAAVQEFGSPYAAASLASHVSRQNLIDHRNQQIQLRLLNRLRPRVAGRQREPGHLRDRLAAQTKHPGRFASAVAIGKHKAPNRRVGVRSKHPQPIPNAVTLSTGRILLRRAQHNADAPVAGFVTATHKPDEPYRDCQRYHRPVGRN